MSSEFPHRVLIVANRTASTPHLLNEVHTRARAGARFGLLIPPTLPGSVDWQPDDAMAMLARAGASQCELVDDGPDAALRVHQLIAAHEFDEVIVSTEHHHLERWRHHDIQHRLRDLDVPVTVIPPEPHSWGPIEGFPPEWVPHAASPAAIAGFGNY